MSIAVGAGRSLAVASYWGLRQIAHSHQVVGRQCEAEHPVDARNPTMASLTQSAYGLEPTKDLLYPFALALTNRVALMPGSALVDRTGLLAGEMRSYSMLTHFLNQFFAVVTFVSAQGDPMPARNFFHH